MDKIDFETKAIKSDKKDPEMPLLVYIKKKKPKTPKSNLKKICVPIFIAALFTIPKIQRQPKYPLVDEWMKRCYIYAIQYRSDAKIISGILQFSMT